MLKNISSIQYKFYLETKFKLENGMNEQPTKDSIPLFLFIFPTFECIIILQKTQQSYHITSHIQPSIMQLSTFQLSLLLLLLPCLLCNYTYTYNEEYEKQKSFWFQIQRFEGTFYQQEVSYQLGPCNPCQYMIQLMPDKVSLTYFNPMKPKNCHVISQQFPTESSFILLQRQLNLTSMMSQYFVQMQPRDGYLYHFQISFKIDAIYINHTQTRYRYFIPILLFLHSCIAFLVYRLENERLKEFMREVFDRSSLALVCMYAQLGTLLTLYQLFIVIEYLLNFQHFVGKIAAYSLMGTGILLGMIQTGYMYAVLQKKLEHYFPQVPEDMTSTQKSLFRLTIFLVVFLVGLLFYPLLLTAFHKEIWFSYFCLLGLIIDFISAKLSNIRPYKRLSLAYLIEIYFLTLLSSYYPILNFHQSNRITLLLFFVISLIIFELGHCLLKNNVSEVSIREEKPIKYDRSGSNFIEDNFSHTAYKMKSEELIRSDVQLDSRAI